MHINWHRGETRAFARKHRNEQPHWWRRRDYEWEWYLGLKYPLDVPVVPRHLKVRGRRPRPWLIMALCSKKYGLWGCRRKKQEWYVWGRYITRQARDYALKDVRTKRIGTWSFYEGYRFKAVDPD